MAGSGSGGAGTAGSAVSSGGAGASGSAAGAGAGGTKAAASAAGSGGDKSSAGATAQAGSPAAGSGGAPAPVVPVLRDSKYLIELADTSLEVDPQLGGRVVRFARAGQNLLTGSDVDPLNWGSTFWPSPQARWNWPPVPELDSQPYTATLAGDVLTLVSAPGMRAKVRVTKRFRALPEARAIEIEYQLENTDTAAASWAPWEISRVAPGGLTFFPTGTAPAALTQLPVVNQAGATWYLHEPARVPMAGQKFAGDGSGGWLAHVAGRTLFLKQFSDVPAAQQAPSPEAEIEIYAAPGYVEIEPQGPYTQLMPGGRVEWRVRWSVRQLPDALKVEVGNAALFEFARMSATP